VIELTTGSWPRGELVVISSLIRWQKAGKARDRKDTSGVSGWNAACTVTLSQNMQRYDRSKRRLCCSPIHMHQLSGTGNCQCSIPPRLIKSNMAPWWRRVGMSVTPTKYLASLFISNPVPGPSWRKMAHSGTLNATPHFYLGPCVFQGGGGHLGSKGAEQGVRNPDMLGGVKEAFH
jgi:hypothetical protein